MRVNGLRKISRAMKNVAVHSLQALKRTIDTRALAL